jgi:hypothetical protein
VVFARHVVVINLEQCKPKASGEDARREQAGRLLSD